MKLLSNLFKKQKTVDEPIYMTSNASVVCSDKQNGTTKKVQINFQHIDPDADIQLEFPRIEVVKTSSKDGMIGMYRKHVMNLDTDDMPTEGSKNLLTSGVLYQIISELTQRIKELESKIKK